MNITQFLMAVFMAGLFGVGVMLATSGLTGQAKKALSSL